MDKSQTLSQIMKYKVTAIMRGVGPDKALPVVDALYEGGIRLLEVTFNQKNPDNLKETPGMIAAIAAKYGGRMTIGAGTVMTAEQAKAAVDAGARFVLAPNTDAAVIQAAVKLGAVAVPGALTATEVAFAYAQGAEVVKLFPAGEMGVAYIKALRGPLNHIPLMAVGGVDEKNMQSFFDAGICSVGIGSNIVKLSLIEKNDFAGLIELARLFTCQIQ